MSLRNRTSISIAFIVATFWIGFVLGLQLVNAQTNVKKEDRDPIPTVYALVRLQKVQPILPNPRQTQDSFDKANELLKRTEVALVKSRETLSKALSKNPVRALPIVQKQENPTEWLKKVLEVDFPNDGNLMRIGMSGSNPKDMAIIVNSIVEAYAENSERAAKVLVADRYETVDRLLIELEEKMRQQSAHLRKLSEILGTRSPVDQRMTQDSLQDCTRELRRVRLERLAVQVKLTRKPADQDEGKESKTGSKRLLEEQMTILTEQEKLLVQEEMDLRKKIEIGSLGSVDIEIRREDIAVTKKVIRRLREERERLDLEKSNRRPAITVVELADAPISK